MRKREGIEPRYEREIVGADVVSKTEGHINEAALAMASANPPGSETGARHQGKVGNSGGPRGSSTKGSRVAQLVNQEEARWARGSRMSPYERGGGVTPTEQRGTQ
jgi:Ni/Co efflux regulator RcnB